MLKQLDVLIGFVVVMSIVSLLVTIITQAISSLLGLRGRNLSDALQAMMRRINPDIDIAAAQQLVGHILTRPVISDSTLSMLSKTWNKWPILAWFRKNAKLASAIRPDELLELIRSLASRGSKSNPELSQALQTAATSLLDSLKIETPATANAITAFQTQFATIAGRDLTQARALITQASNATDTALINLERWFNSAQDRAQQWFAMHARMITVLAAFAAAFVLQLDSLDLIKRISADSDLRDKLVAASDTVQNLAKDTLSEQRNHIDQATHQTVMVNLKKKYPQLSSASDKNQDFPSLKESKQWVSDQIKADDPQHDSIVADYGQLITAAKLEASLDLMTKVAGSSPLQLLPTPYPISFNRSWPQGRFGWIHIFKVTDPWSWPPHRLLGILISAALLSLGAPFWFNTLKSLTNLRPKLAEEVDKDPNQVPEMSASK
jgi:hypothetical protein